MDEIKEGIRGNYATGIATRAAIVAAARDVLAERGFHGTSIAEIAAKVGISPRGVRHHFASKEEILLAAMDDRLERYRDWMRTLVEDDGVDILSAHVELMRLYTSSAVDTAWHISMAGASINDSHPAHEWFDKRYEFLRVLLTGLMRDGQNAGSVRRDVSAEALGVGMMSLTEGILLQWLRDQDSFDAVETMRQMADAMRPPEK